MATDATTSALTPGPSPPVFYPERDGKPMGETPVHREVMVDLIAGFKDWFVADPQVYVSGNMFLYFVEGVPQQNVSPDVMVVQGIDAARYRATYKTWEEGGKAPDLAIEISSKATRREDLCEKFALYRDTLRVREYFLFDPLAEYLQPRFQGFRLEDETYVVIEPVAGRLPSVVLGLHLVAAGETVRLWNPTTGRIIPTRLEALAAAQKASQRKTSTIRDRGAIIRGHEMTIREQGMTIREHEMTIRERDAALADREMTIREREMTIREQAMTISEREMTIQQKELAIGHQGLALREAALEVRELQAEIARLKGE